MSLSQNLFAEFEAQAPITRRFLERLPENKLTWKPHEKSMSAGNLALHISRAHGGVVRFVQQNPAQAPDFTSVPGASQSSRNSQHIRGQHHCGQECVAAVR